MSAPLRTARGITRKISTAVVLLLAASTLFIATPAAGIDFLTDGDWQYFVDIYSAGGPGAVASVYTGSDVDVVIPSELGGYPVTVLNGGVFSDTYIHSVKIPNTMTYIGQSAFQNSTLASIDFGSSVTSIGDFAFDNTALTSISLPPSVTSIGYSSFSNTGIESATIGDNVTSVGDYAFWGNSSLSSLTIGASLTSIGEAVFKGCALTSVTIPSSVTSIGNEAFDSNSLTSVTIPASITSVGAGAFAHDTKLTSVNLLGNAPNASAANASTGSFGAAGVAVHYLTGATGFTNPWKGYTTSVAAALPAVTGVSPTTGAGATSVTITGTALAGATAVNFGTVAATNVVPVSATQVTATAPAGTGTVHVSVTTPSGTSATSAADQFTYAAAANSFQIYVQIASGTKYPVTVTGDELVSEVKSAVLLLTSVPVASQKLIFSGKALLDSSTMTGASIQLDSVLHLIVIVAAVVPVVTSLSPTSGDTAGSTSVTITGTGFTGATSILFGTALAVVTSVTDTSITANTPAGAPGAVQVTVTTPSGTSGPAAFTFVTPLLVPTISGFTPMGGPLAGGTVLTLIGTGFTASSSVSIGGSSAKSVVFNSPTSLTVTVPAHSAGGAKVYVTTAGGTSVIGLTFAYVAAPTVAAVSPSSGSTLVGTPVTISGTNFSGGSTVLFGGFAATSVAYDKDLDQLTAVAPAGIAGIADVTVTDVGGTSAVQSSDQFTYIQFVFVSPPTVTGISPAQGTSVGGTAVSITGSGFSSSSTVKFGTVAGASVQVVDSTHLTVVSPAGAAGAVDVTVSTLAGTSATSASDTFTWVVMLAHPTTGADSPTLVAAIGTAYTSYTFTATGSPAPTFTLASGQLPPGLSLNQTSGVLSGIPEGTGGTYTFSVKSSNGQGTPADGALHTITINAPPVLTVQNPVLTASVGTLYTPYQYTATGYPAPTFTTTGSLPPGMSLSLAGVLLGAPTGTGGTYTFAVVASNGKGADVTGTSHTITVAASPVWTADAPALTATVGTSYSYAFAATGYPTPMYAIGGTLPPGLTLTAGVLAGIPTGTGGTYTFQLNAYNAGNANGIQHTITVAAAPVFTADAPALTATVGASFGEYQFAATGYPSPTFTATSGAVPSGMTLSASGLLTGIPTGTGGTFAFTVTASNASDTAGIQHTITVSAAPLLTADAPALTATVGEASTPYQFVATGYPIPTFTANGDLPAGLTLSGSGVFSGTATGTGGTYTFSVTASNQVGADATGSPHTVTVLAAPLFTADHPPRANLGVPYSYTFTATGYPLPTYVLTGTLPAGLTLSDDGVISGTPTASDSSPFTITASNGVGDPAVTPALSIPVDEPVIALNLGFAVGQQIGDSKTTATGLGLLPDSPWLLQVFSTPQTIGSGKVGPTGSISYPFTVPTNLPAGVHHLLLTGTSATGQPMSAVAWFTLTASGKVLAVSTTGPTPSLADLAYTGGSIDIQSNVLAGLIALVIGTGLVFRRRLINTNSKRPTTK